MPELTDENVAYFLANAGDVRVEGSLHEFIRRAWPVLEPFRPLVDSWCLGAVAEHLQAVTDGQITRLVINIPPGCTKSMSCNVLWPAWEWGPWGSPHHRFISASYDQSLATRDLVRCRDLIKSDWYSSQWPIEFKPDQDEKTYYENTKTGWRKSVGVRGAMTGYRGHRIIIDDPHSVTTAESKVQRDETLRWGSETVPTRLDDDDTSAIVLMMQRLHEQDLTALYLSEHMEGDWVHLMLPMEFEGDRRCRTTVVMPNGETFEDRRTEEGQLLVPELKSRDAVDRLKRTLSALGGNYARDGQLQQRPTSRGGNLFRRDDFLLWEGPLPKNRKRVRGWDLAATTKSRSACTAGVLMSRLPDGRIIVEDCINEQLGPFEVEERIKHCAEFDGPRCRASIPQDPGAAGVAWKVHMAAKLGGHDVRFSPETGDKDYRAQPLAAQVEAGMVYLYPGSWNSVYLSEMAAFGPGSARKDVTDASTRAYAELAKMADPDIALLPPQLFTG